MKLEIVRKNSILGQMIEKRRQLDLQEKQSDSTHEHSFLSGGIYEKLVCTICSKEFWKKVEKA